MIFLKGINNDDIKDLEKLKQIHLNKEDNYSEYFIDKSIKNIGNQIEMIRNSILYTSNN